MGDCGDVQKVFVATKDEDAPRPAPVKGVQITPKAADKIRLFLENEGKSVADYGLRVSVTKDGCSGLSYQMSLSELEKSRQEGDKIFELEGSHLMIEKTSYFYVVGSTLDYTEALTGSGFTIGNPNVKKTCSCGSSFAV